MKTYFVDSFTTLPFRGNPAAVCLLETDLDAATMQDIATEIGFSETAFIKQVNDHHYNIRFFTPKAEISLCGHATLASSKIIFDSTNLEQIVFMNCEGIELRTGKAAGKIVMQFPVYDTIETEVPQNMLTALGLSNTLVTRFNPERKIILIEIDGTRTLSDLTPDFPALVQSYSGISGVLVTAKAGDDGFDFHYRYFWPWAGTNEDPVTGGVQTFLTKYWANKLGKNTLTAFQSSRRTGTMQTELHEDKVWIYGEAVTMFEGTFKNAQP